MTQRPLVALTATVHDDDGRREQPAVFLYASYIEALEGAGLAPVLLTPAHSPAAVAALMAACRGLVISGGEDVAPARFGAAPHPALGATSPARDGLEWLALDLARAARLPVLGICRGIQVLNVYLGGTLYQDLPAELPGCLDHDPAIGLGARVHPVTVAAGSRLRHILGADSVLTNSSHHQAVCELAPALAVTARTADGVIEGAETRDGSWVVAVQWHPERQPADATDQDHDRRLFRAFRDAVSAGGREAGSP